MLVAYRYLLALMTPQERKRFWLLVVISFFLAAIEAGSVLSILPFLQLLADPDLIRTNGTIARVYDLFGFESDRQFLIAVGIAVFVITVFGLAMKMITMWVTARFALMRAYSFSSRLMSGYLHQPYEWFLSKHTAELGSGILTEVDRVVSGAMLPAMRIIPEGFTVLMLLFALCLMEPWVALGGIVLLGGFYALVFLKVRGVLGRLGEIQTAANERRYHAVQEAMGGVKELKIMRLEAGFLSRFRAAAFERAKAQTKGQVITVLPRYSLEAIAFGAMILLILVLLVRGDGQITSILPTLGLIAAMGLRLIPALQQLYVRFSNLRQAMSPLKKLHDDMTGFQTAPSIEAPRDTMHLHQSLDLDDIHYSYPGTEQSALRGLTVSIQANTTIGIVGGTGAGKTTLVDIILGLLEPSSGTMRINGQTISEQNRGSWQRTLGYVPQTIFLSDGTVAENIAFGQDGADIDMGRVVKAAKIAALDEFVSNEMPHGYDTKVGERGVRMSGGQRQRVGIARALYRDPSTLILDEATSALDTLTEAAVMEAVANIAGQKTVLMIAHRLSTVRNCDRILLLRNGIIAAEGRYDELIERDDEFRRMTSMT